jgi:hypothetical protein
MDTETNLSEIASLGMKSLYSDTLHSTLSADFSYVSTKVITYEPRH